MTYVIGGGQDKPKESKIVIPGKRQSILEPGESYMEKGLRMMIDQKFTRNDLFQVISEKHVFNKDTQYIYDQEHGTLPEICEVRFQGEWICDINANMRPDFAYAVILDGLKKLKEKLERRIS